MRTDRRERTKPFQVVPGSICAPLGFKAAAVFCDIKKLGTGKGSEKGKKNDLALIVSEKPAVVAGMFTTNQVCAAPVKWSAQVAAAKMARAVVVNSGNANACTGRQGMEDTERMARLSASALEHDVKPEEVMVCSTGRIGVPMPMKNVERGIRACVPFLERSTEKARAVAEAIMTSDTRRKEIAVELELGKKSVRLGGMCKGAGMIQPGMAPGARLGRPLHATMLGFLTTDASVEPKFLKQALSAAVGQSFNRITVDGDMSTNDSVIILANGLAANRRIDGATAESREFQRALDYVTLELAKMIVRDGEGVSRFVTIRLRGAHNVSEAEAAARAIANSALVKTSWCGGDPNWGRILCAMGYSRARINESVIDIGYSRPGEKKVTYAFRKGRPAKTTFSTLTAITSCPEFDLHVDLHLGGGEFVMYASDLTEDYVTFNKGDITDPASLGG